MVMLAKIKKSARPYGGRWLRVVNPPYRTPNGNEYVDLIPPPISLDHPGPFGDIRQYPTDTIEKYKEVHKP